MTSVLPVLAFLHLVCAWIASCVASRRTGLRPIAGKARQSLSSFAVLGTVPYVRNLALLILFSTMGTALLDYAFKVRVSAAFDGDLLVRPFAFFYATVGVATFLVQLLLVLEMVLMLLKYFKVVPFLRVLLQWVMQFLPTISLLIEQSL
jgi:hypothetical protein